MQTDGTMTKQEAEDMIKQLEKVFDIVRLLDKETLYGRSTIKTDSGDICQCYSFWGIDQPCENCISFKVMEDKVQRTKLELLGQDFYQVISKYVEIEGKAYVMEMINRLDREVLVDTDGKNKLLSEISGYNDKLYKDALTGVYNRRYFEEKVKSSRFSTGVAMIDLDDFKIYNDTYGHEAGDMVLDTVVQIIKKDIRKSDILIRYGGDEFLLLLPDIKGDAFEIKLRQLQERIHAAAVPGYSQLRLSVSIGGVLSEGEKIEDAIRRADKYMYQAKITKNSVATERSQLSDEETDKDKKKGGQKILIIDDSEMNRMLLSEMLGSEFNILEAENGEKGLKMLHKYGNSLSVVLLDIVMPVMDGFEVLDYMIKEHWNEEIPVIMISSENSPDTMRKAYEMGVVDYISRPFDARVVYRRVLNTIKLYAKQRRLVTLITNQVYEKEKNNRMMISILSQIVEFRNGESGQHVLNINILTGLLLERLVQKTDKYHLNWSDRLLITTASALHDIGKIGISDRILNKPGPLTEEEFEIVKRHPIIGASILKNLALHQDEPLVKVAYEICRWHHERYDGGGYPDGLVGEQIPISAQIVSLADVYDALVSDRIYKKAYSHKEAIRMILDGECGKFNPLLLECLEEIQDKIREELAVQDSGKVEEAFCNIESSDITNISPSKETGENASENSEELLIPKEKRMDFREYETVNKKFLHSITKDLRSECVRPMELSDITPDISVDEIENSERNNEFHSRSRVEEHKKSRWQK